MGLKRSQQKRITKEAIILRHMRLERRLSLNQAGDGGGITGSAIAHMEQGRMDVSRKRIETLVAAYGYTLDDYLELYELPKPPIHIRDECLAIIRQLDDARLQAVHAVLVNLVPSGSARQASSPRQRDIRRILPVATTRQMVRGKATNQACRPAADRLSVGAFASRQVHQRPGKVTQT